MSRWADLLPQLWAYKPKRSAFADPQAWRSALTEHAASAAAEAVARRIPQPKSAAGDPLFVSPDPLGLSWLAQGADRQRDLWAAWLRDTWQAEDSGIEQPSRAITEAARVTEAEFRRTPDFVKGLRGVFLGAAAGFLLAKITK